MYSKQRYHCWHILVNRYSWENSLARIEARCRMSKLLSTREFTNMNLYWQPWQGLFSLSSLRCELNHYYFNRCNGALKMSLCSRIITQFKFRNPSIDYLRKLNAPNVFLLCRRSFKWFIRLIKKFNIEICTYLFCIWLYILTNHFSHMFKLL